jgi:hypothetical protein
MKHADFHQLDFGKYLGTFKTNFKILGCPRSRQPRSDGFYI